MDFATRADLAGRLRGLVIMLDEYLTLEQCRTADQAIDADDYGPALEMLAGWCHTTPQIAFKATSAITFMTMLSPPIFSATVWNSFAQAGRARNRPTTSSPSDASTPTSGW